MKWSLRDEKQMEELGFSKSARCQRYYEMRNKIIGSEPQTNNQNSQMANIDQFGSLYSS